MQQAQNVVLGTGRFFVIPFTQVGGQPAFKIGERDERGAIIKSSKTYFDEHEALSQAIALNIEEQFHEVVRLT